MFLKATFYLTESKRDVCPDGVKNIFLWVPEEDQPITILNHISYASYHIPYASYYKTQNHI